MTKSMLTVRGVMEEYENKSGLPDYLQGRKSSRANKWEWIHSAHSDFRRELKAYLGFRLNDIEAGNLASDLYANTSSGIHSFSKERGVEIQRGSFTSNQRRFLRALCKVIPCGLTEHD